MHVHIRICAIVHVFVVCVLGVNYKKMSSTWVVWNFHVPVVELPSNFPGN